jgi:hypothetical protein
MTLKLALAALVASAATVAEAHYTFANIRHNGEWQGGYKYIRNKTDHYEGDGNEPGNSVRWRGFHWPTFPTDSAQTIRCGRDHMAWAADTDVLTVQAGDELEIAIDAGDLGTGKQQFDNCPDDRGACMANSDYIWRIIHDGPALVHLSPVPAGQDVHEYDGSGAWTKIFSMGLEWRRDTEPVQPLFWLPHNKRENPPRIVFKIPAQTPAGEYLMRMDIIWGSRGAGSQLYPSCAQIRVESDSTTTLPEGVRIPEAFTPTSPGMKESRQILEWKGVDKDYEYPGGPLWNGEELVEDKPLCPEGDPTDCQAKK